MNKLDSDTTRLDLFIEALIFAAEYALSVQEIQKSIETTFVQKFDPEIIIDEIEKIRTKYSSADIAIQLVSIADGFMFMTKPQFHRIIEDYLRNNEKKKLSRAAIETLSIIAYKQPITKSTLESIRGVNSDYTIQKLLEKELVEIGGREEGPGRPLLYCTTVKFLDHFGLKDASDLPKLKEIEPIENSIGESAPPDENYEGDLN